MIEPFLSDDALLADIQNARGEGGELHVWWLGQSGFLVQWNGQHALLDPYLSDSLTKKYAATDKPHVRMSRRVIAPERLDFIDVVSSSHVHTDHLDPETLQPLFSANPDLNFIVPSGINFEALKRAKCSANALCGLDDGASVDVGCFRFEALPAAHNTIERDEVGRCKFLGYVVSVGPFQIYHSGDTLMYDGLDERLKAMALDLALLPINGDVPERHVAGNLNGTEAANLAKAAEARMVVPCHYDMFEFNTASPDEFVAECVRLGQTHRVLRLGERMTIEK
ncbi:MAG: MBL fold metallo-hydrolase [Planctomycetota bacterium]